MKFPARFPVGTKSASSAKLDSLRGLGSLRGLDSLRELDSLRGSSIKLGTKQRRLAWPLRKDDTHTMRSVNTCKTEMFVQNVCCVYVTCVCHLHMISCVYYVVFSNGSFQWIVSGMFQRSFTSVSSRAEVLAGW